MIIDFHTHIFPEEMCDNREKYFASESAFKLLYSSPTSRLTGGRGLLASMDEHGVDVSVVFGFPWSNSENFKKNNDYIMEAVEKYPERLKGFCCFDPFNPEAASEVERCLGYGLSGIGELAFYHRGINDDALERLQPVMEICQEKDVPVLIHTNEPFGHMYPGKSPITLNQIYRLIISFPKNKIVLAHWGGGIFFFNLLRKEVKESLKNVYFDTAASPFLYDPEIYSLAIQIVGNEKILFGSDFPLIKPLRYFKEFEIAGLPDEDLENICGKNAARLLNL